MAASRKRPRSENERASTRVDQISIIVRVVMMIWEIVWTVIQEGTGPGRRKETPGTVRTFPR